MIFLRLCVQNSAIYSRICSMQGAIIAAAFFLNESANALICTFPFSFPRIFRFTEILCFKSIYEKFKFLFCQFSTEPRHQIARTVIPSPAPGSVPCIPLPNGNSAGALYAFVCVVVFDFSGFHTPSCFRPRCLRDINKILRSIFADVLVLTMLKAFSQCTFID